jgi:hypothetical protein
MNKAVTLVAVVLLLCSAGFAASSGNFAATGTSAACVICNANASTPNPACANTLGNGNFVGGTTLSSFTANISTSNGNGVTLDIRPDLVTGLFTDTKISTTVPSATAEVGIQVCVTVDGSGANVLPTSCVMYDERFQQLSSQLFSQLSECTNVPIAGSVCTTNSPSCAAVCPAGDVCTCNLGATGTCTLNPGTACSTTNPCTAPNDTCNFTGSCVEQNNLCNIELILSTLSAHSFDFLVNMPGTGNHTVVASWSMVDANATTGANEAACVGPGILTVTQYHVFKGQGNTFSFSSL